MLGVNDDYSDPYKKAKLSSYRNWNLKYKRIKPYKSRNIKSKYLYEGNWNAALQKYASKDLI